MPDQLGTRSQFVRKIVFGLLLVASALVWPTTAAVAESHDVHIVNGVPDPQQLSVADGDTVVFVNDDDVARAIFAQGEQRGDTIMPHQKGGPYGPFTGAGAEYDYQIDNANGPTGVIFVGGPPPTSPPPTTRPPTPTTAHPVTPTTAAPVTTTTTAIALPPATTVPATTTTTTTSTTQPSTTTSSETA